MAINLITALLLRVKVVVIKSDRGEFKVTGIKDILNLSKVACICILYI
jgi:hypothetical protein